MPSTSAKQAKFMRAVSHSPSFAKKVGVAQKVGKDFEMADKKMKKFGGGGVTKSTKPTPKPAPKPLPVDPDYEDEGVMKAKPPAKPVKPIKKDPDNLGSRNLAKGGKAMKGCYDDGGEAKGGKMKKYAKGGGVFRSSANGIAKKGLTKAKMPKMAKGGRAKGCK